MTDDDNLGCVRAQMSKGPRWLLQIINLFSYSLMLHNLIPIHSVEVSYPMTPKAMPGAMT